MLVTALGLTILLLLYMKMVPKYCISVFLNLLGWVLLITTGSSWGIYLVELIGLGPT